MNEMPAILGLAASAARHAASRQAVIATNVANADTPGFRARDMDAFSPDDGFALRRTSAAHFAGATRTDASHEIRDAGADPNGNTVDLEDQVLRGIEAARVHDRAITVYRSSLDMLRASLGKR
ncbi:Putative proximal rod protein [Jannaschia rubra]|uniref:Putative proximal rod protein n=2 Tax=Jannaschia rubra TaxID=282197 RepID=A0A0M6XQ05_9RHOB|nr:Putative proximal rod protein [Jannaschia rubra]SFF97459.1 flagellar basal-body rod protein FlgB [Jannaschia rubra]